MKKVLFVLFCLYAARTAGQNPDWPLSNDGYDTTRITALTQKIRDSVFKDIQSIVVIKNERLLLETYFNGAQREQLHDVRSVGKTLVTALLGIAIDKGYVKNVRQRLGDFHNLARYQHPSVEKSRVTLHHLLTMSSAFDGDDSDDNSAGNEEKMYPTANWVDFALNLPMDSARQNGQSWRYFTAGAVILGDILDKKVPEGLEKFAEKNLFRPLSIAHYQWQYTPQKVVNTAGGIQMRAVDLAKLGYLFQNGGRWKGHRIFSEKWARTALSRHIAVPFDGMGYGYFMWQRFLKANGKTYETFNMLGNGGNRVVIMPNAPFVIVVTASAYNKPYGHRQVDTILQDYILPAIDPPTRRD